MAKTEVAIIGSGHIGTDLMVKILRLSDRLTLSAMIGIDPESEGLAAARRLGVPTSHEGVSGLRRMPGFERIRLVFDATSAGAHRANADALAGDDITLVDLTPAAIGPFVVPAVNLDTHIGARNVNMVTCGGQATIPIVAAISRVAKVHYAEIVASIASKSAGPGTRANIDEFTETTARGLERVGGATRGKAIIVLNPAEPPLIMRDSVICLCDPADREALVASVDRMVAEVQAHVPGYRLKHALQVEPVEAGLFEGAPAGLKVSAFLEIEGAGHHLPRYAGNLDIMTSAALATGERIAAARHREMAQ